MTTDIVPKPRNLPIDPAKVNGWGVDADANNDPTYPYRIRTESGGKPMDWERPTLQRTDVEILRSIEHNRRPAVSGTALPPKGVSGAIRRAAFGYSENDWRHWLLLLGADRVNVVEGLVEDLARGRVPNIPGEMGLRAELRHNPGGLARKAAVAAGVGALAYLLWQRRGQPRPGHRAPVRTAQRDALPAGSRGPTG